MRIRTPYTTLWSGECRPGVWEVSKVTCTNPRFTEWERMELGRLRGIKRKYPHIIDEVRITSEDRDAFFMETDLFKDLCLPDDLYLNISHYPVNFILEDLYNRVNPVRRITLSRPEHCRNICTLRERYTIARGAFIISEIPGLQDIFEYRGEAVSLLITIYNDPVTRVDLEII